MATDSWKNQDCRTELTLCALVGAVSEEPTIGLIAKHVKAVIPKRQSKEDVRTAMALKLKTNQ